MSDNSPQPAYKLWVELATRITTERLHYRAGVEETAAKSIYSLFGKVRILLEENPQAAEFRDLAVELLNKTLRPYTARWHGWMAEDKERKDGDGNPLLVFRDEQVRRKFRKELQELLRPPLVECRARLAAMAGIEDKPEEDRESLASLGQPVVPGIGQQVVMKAFAGSVGAQAINLAEHKAILERRRLLHGTDETQLTNATGLALSGGGIRSATFCLGIVQVLVSKGLLPKFDYLSTVSGGGYLGSFLSCALGTEENPAGVPPTREQIAARINDVFHRIESGTESGLIRHLRNNSKYLLNGGVKARLQIVGLLLSGILYNILMVLPLPLVAVLLVYGFNELGWWGGSIKEVAFQWPGFDHGVGRALVASSITLAGAWLLLPLIQLLTHGRPPRSFGAVLRRKWEWVTIIAGLLTCSLGLLYLLPALFHGYDWLRGNVLHSDSKGLKQWSDLWALSAAGAGSVLLGLLGTWIKSHWPRLRSLVIKLFILSGPLLLLLVFLVVANRLGFGRGAPTTDAAGPPWNFWPVFWVTAGMVLWAWLCVNINTLAPHRYYRSKLCECYLARRTDELKPRHKKLWQSLAGEPAQGRTESLQQVKLTHLGAFAAAPYHLINTTLNLPGSSNKELRGRDGDFFLVSKLFCGAPTVGYVATSEVEKRDSHFDLGTAMAVSGAAASTSMGWKSMPHFRFLMTLFNVRLGYWLGRPGSRPWPALLERPGPWSLFQEMLGNMDENGHYLNLSDGGHIENLAAYELLRRKCKFIVCVDAGQEPGMECSDLMRLERYANIDLGVRLEYDVTDLKLQPNGFSRAYATLVKIDYTPDRTGEDKEIGWMLYLKLAALGTEPPFVKDYRRDNPDFPHQTTADQLYEEAQFEAYRALGECAAENMFRDEILDVLPPGKRGQPLQMDDWFTALATCLLPDNDPAFGSKKV